MSTSSMNLDAFGALAAGAGDDIMMMNSKVYVEHNYTDHFNVPIYRPIDEINNKRRGPRGGVLVPFPEKLYQMLNQIAADGLDDVVSWQPHGRCFVVHQPERFVKEVMPRYFSQTKLTSFQRQVNLYGFRRLTAGNDRNGYYHELFLRGRPDLLKRMNRVRVKGTGCKLAPSPATEPNFYRLPYCHGNVPMMNAMDMVTSQVVSSGQNSRRSCPDSPMVSIGTTSSQPHPSSKAKKNTNTALTNGATGGQFATINSFLRKQMMRSDPALADNSTAAPRLQSFMAAGLPPPSMPDNMRSFPFGNGDFSAAPVDLTPLPPCSTRNYLLEMRDDILEVLSSSQTLWADNESQQFSNNDLNMNMDSTSGFSQSLSWAQHMFEI